MREASKRSGDHTPTKTPQYAPRSEDQYLPTYMTNEQLVDVVLDGIGGLKRSLARWALSELARRADTCSKGITHDTR